jgi:hypothetical protein
MGNFNKSAPLLLIILIIASVSLMAKPANAQTMPKPSVPEFTINFVPSSYSIATTDPYTGQSTSTTVSNNTIQLTIKNQPIPSSVPSNDSINLYYNVETKGHSSNEWTSEYSFPTWASSDSDFLSGSYNTTLPVQSKSQYTVLSFPADYTSGDQIDFRVEALLAYQVTVQTYQGGILVPFPETTFAYQSSGWSSIQTFTMPNTFLIDNLPYMIISIVVVGIFVVAVVLLLHRRQRKTSPPS